ncbi:MAG: AraC family transcriptional regulator [Myxococcales bacterium]|nr:AraC family transcriptional regulator [Myxococcales bacterium]
MAAGADGSRIMMRSERGVVPLGFGDGGPRKPVLNSLATPWAGVPFELHETTSMEEGVRSGPLPGRFHLRVVVEGSFVLTFRGPRRDVRFPVRTGSLSFHGETDMIPLRCEGAARMVVIDVPDTWVERLGHGHPPLDRGVHSLANGDESARSLAAAMCTEVSREAPTGVLFAESLSLALLSYAFDRLPVERIPVRGGLSHAQRRMLQRYIDERLGENLRIDELAGVCGLKPRQFTVLFQRAFGQTPYRYLLQRRLERGASLLATSSKGVAEIAFLTGFCSQSHFTTSFRRAYGTTPRQYANAHRYAVQAPGGGTKPS